jgi:hypothetical protein
MGIEEGARKDRGLLLHGQASKHPAHDTKGEQSHVYCTHSYYKLFESWSNIALPVNCAD